MKQCVVMSGALNLLQLSAHNLGIPHMVSTYVYMNVKNIAE